MQVHGLSLYIICVTETLIEIIDRMQHGRFKRYRETVYLQNILQGKSLHQVVPTLTAKVGFGGTTPSLPLHPHHLT